MPSIDDGFEALLEPFYNGKKLTDPISTKDDKFQLLPAFLKVKGALSSCLVSILMYLTSYLDRARQTVCEIRQWLVRSEISLTANVDTLTHTTSSSSTR